MLFRSAGPTPTSPSPARAATSASPSPELLVEETWLEALSGELLKPYALDLCRFVALERLHAKVPVYPPPHLVFHAPNRAAAR